MSEINLDFNLSNIVQNITVEEIEANVSVNQIDLTLTTQPLNITVEGTGAYYTGAINNSPVAYSSSNVFVPVPPITLSAATSNFAVAEFNVTGTTPTTVGTSAEDVLTFTGATPPQGTLATYANANFSLTGITPQQFNNDATQANAVITFSGNSSAPDGGVTTKYNIDALQELRADVTTSWSIIVPAYGQYPQLSTTINFTNGDNANTALTKVEANLTNLRPTFSFTTSSYTSNTPNLQLSTRSNLSVTTATSTSLATSNNQSVVFFTVAGRIQRSLVTGGNVTTANVSGSLSYDSAANFAGFSVKSAYAQPNQRWCTPDFLEENPLGDGNGIYRVWTSSNANTWTSYNVGDKINYGTAVAWPNIAKVVVEANGSFFTSGVSNISNFYWPTIYTSTDGATWTSAGYHGSYPFQIMLSVASDGSNYVVAASNGTFKTSNIANLYGGNMVTGRSDDVTWTGSQWVAVSNTGVIRTSPNAESGSWTVRSSDASLLYSVAHDNGGTVMAVGGSRIVYSFDHGNTWATLTNTTGGNVLDVSWDQSYNSNLGRFLLSTAGNTVYQVTRPSYRRLQVDTNYTITGGNLLISPVNITGSNTTPIWSTEQGTAALQLYDIVEFSDGVNGQSLQMAYNQTSETITSDIIRRLNVTGWTPSVNSANSILMTRNSVGLIDVSQQISANYNISAGGGGGTAVANRTSSYLGSNNSTNPQPTLQLDLDGAIASINLPYNTNLATVTDYPSIITPLGWTVTQPGGAGNFTITNNTIGIVSNIGGVILNSPLTTITRTSYNDGSTTIPDPNTPYLQIQFDPNSGINPNPYRIYLPWDTSAAALADYVRINSSAFGITFSGLPGTGSVFLTAVSIGPQARPLYTKGGTGSAAWDVTDVYTNGTGSTASIITVDEGGGVVNMFPILGNRNPQQIITDFITGFYSDRWRIIRTGSNQFSLVAIQLGPQTQPVITTNVSPPTILLNSWTNGTIPSGTIPGYSIDIGRIGVVLPGITLVQN